MFFISKIQFEREVNNRVEEIMREERLHMLERRVKMLEHPEPKDSRDVPTTCKCGD